MKSKIGGSLISKFIAAAFFSTLVLLAPTAKAGSWYYNENGGFGIYVPEGWSSTENGRSAEINGPRKDVSQSRIFMGSDWVPKEKAKDVLSLKLYMQNELGLGHLSPTSISGLDGFSYGDSQSGGTYLLRVPSNVIVIEYDLRGSADQVDEGKTALSSIEIRTKPIESLH
jgi:hypothetical protein